MTDTVRRRRVFYIPGYDPFPPRRYRELYRKEGAEQAASSGYSLSQGKGDGPCSWVVTAEIEGTRVVSDIEVLVWSDIVADSMSASIAATYVQLVRTSWIYLASGALFQLMRLRKGPVIAALYPIVFLVAQLLVAVGTGLGLGWGVIALWPGGMAPAWPVGGASGLAAAILLLRWFRARDSRVFAHYLMHDYAFSARSGGANPSELEDRMAVFGGRIGEALETEVDEVLVVGHSSGAHLAISVLADLLGTGCDPKGRLSLLTLGHVVPMISFLPNASRLRGDLHLMARQDVIPWIDVSAPGDGCAFALCDPVAVSGVAPERQTGPLILSAAFTRTLSPDRWRALKRRYFRLHFQYLCAFDALPGTQGDYDYFRVTAGPMRLADRFAGRVSSPSTLRTPVNRYTSMNR